MFNQLHTQQSTMSTVDHIYFQMWKSYDKITEAEKKLNNGKKFTFYVQCEINW
jgi:uncharacterized hydantoinase/oxoprolinase family protein